MRELLKDVSYIDEILKDGTQKAAKIAGRHMKQIKEIVGFVEV